MIPGPWNPVGYIGERRSFMREDAPAGWVPEDGSSILRAGRYAALFAVIGTTFGAADGTHFNVPDSRGRSGIGVGIGAGLSPRALGDAPGSEDAVVVAHSHTATVRTPTGVASPVFAKASDTDPGPEVATTDSAGVSGVGQNMQPSIAAYYFIYAGWSLS